MVLTLEQYTTQGSGPGSTWSVSEVSQNKSGNNRVFVNEGSTKQNPTFQLTTAQAPVRSPFGINEKRPDASEWSKYGALGWLGLPTGPAYSTAGCPTSGCPTCWVPQYWVGALGSHQPTRDTAPRAALTLELGEAYQQDFFRRIDEWAIETAHANSVAWFGKQHPKELIASEAMYYRCFKDGGEYLPTTRVKVTDEKWGRNATQVYVVRKNAAGTEEAHLGSVNDLIGVSNAKILPIVSVESFWFSGMQFGINFGVAQMMVWPPETGGTFDAFAGTGIALATTPAPEQDAAQQQQQQQQEAAAGYPASADTGLVPPTELVV